MPKDPSQPSWLTQREHRKTLPIFLVEWLSIFAIAWMFWSVMFFSAPGSIPPALAASVVSGLYATCMVYGRLLRATGCKKCASPLPLVRKEIGRRHLPDQEDCIELQYVGEEWNRQLTQVFCRVVRRDIVTYRCRKCNQVWEEKIELPGSGYKLVRRTDMKK